MAGISEYEHAIARGSAAERDNPHNRDPSPCVSPGFSSCIVAQGGVSNLHHQERIRACGQGRFVVIVARSDGDRDRRWGQEVMNSGGLCAPNDVRSPTNGVRPRRTRFSARRSAAASSFLNSTSSSRHRRRHAARIRIGPIAATPTILRGLSTRGSKSRILHMTASDPLSQNRLLGVANESESRNSGPFARKAVADRTSVVCNSPG
jgi:hypothetical protein